MVIAYPAPKKAKKPTPLPEGIWQLSFSSSMTPATIPAGPRISADPPPAASTSEGARQLDIFNLLTTALDPTVKPHPVQEPPGQIKRLHFDVLEQTSPEPSRIVPPEQPVAENGHAQANTVAALPKTFATAKLGRAKRGKKGLPEGVTQLTFSELSDTDTSQAQAEAPEQQPLKLLLKTEAAYERPGQALSFDFDTLTKVAAEPSRTVSPGPSGTGGNKEGDTVAALPKTFATAKLGRAKRGKKNLPEGVAQLTFSELPGTDTGQTQAAAPEQPSPELPLKTEATYERPRQSLPFDFDALAKASAENVPTVPAGEPIAGGTGEGSGELQRDGVRPDSDSKDVSLRSQGDGDSGNPEERIRGRRVILDEPEPGPRASRDFRITPEHGVGSGSLRQKAQANIEAIRLLKALEAEDREATDEEKAVLVRYAGWGALPQMFEPDWKLRSRPEWQQSAAELKELLTKEEYESAKATTPNAHFTSPTVISAIWQGLERLGVSKGTEILEPSMGIGHFFGLMPESLQGGHRTGVELDSITARIAKKLYPDSKIFAQGFEETKLPNDYFDAVVGNVPFGDYGVHDPDMKHSLTRSIHDYFFAKSLEKVRPGGIMALVTSRYTMDKLDDRIRTHLADQADLIGAIRLPNTAFKGNAGTEVVTDVIFLKKRAVGKEKGGEGWQDVKPVSIEGREVPLNEYYTRHSEMMLGEVKLIRGMHRDQEPTLIGELTPEKLQEAISTLPAGIYTPRDQGRSPPPPIQITEPERFIGIKDGAYAEVDGKIVIRNGQTFEPTALSATASIRVRGLMQIRDAVREVFRTQLDDEPEEAITSARQHLNRVYDQFVRRNGYITSKENFRAFTSDPDHPLLLSLENYDAEKKTAAKNVIFERRTLERSKPVEHVETAAEALAIALNESGTVDWKRMAALTGTSVRQMRAELKGQVFQNLEGAWETADEYLSGDVRAKLRAAEAAAEINPTYRENVEALKAVQPPDILPGDINARLGAGWIPRSDIRDFISELLQVKKEDVTVGHAGPIAAWSVNLEYFANRAVANTTTHGTKRAAASSLIEDALNMRTPAIYDYDPANDSRTINQTETIAAREAQQKLKDRFARWIWEDPERTERLAKLYNDTFNTIRLRTYDGSHLTFPGMNRVGLRNNDLDPHQKNAVWRTIQNKNTLLGHCVGAGKTAEITASAMELKRLGLASKPMIVVPNHLVEQWGAAFLQLYPQANIFVAGKEHFTAGNREKAMARIATGNYDAVIISHKSFESLPVSNATFNRFVGKQIASLEEAILEAQAEKTDNRSVVKDLEKAKKRLEARIKDRASREKKDDGVTWEQLGVDRIFVDEADLFKNLGYTTKMNRIAGLSNTESNRALDMYMKTQYLAERGGGTVFATGTPIANTMAEMYTLMRYLAPELLKDAGVEHFDAWAANFGEAVTALELAPDGSGYRMRTRFSKFVNLPELLSMFRTFADIQTAEMLNLPRPEIEGGKPQTVVSPATPELKEFVSGLVSRAQRIRSGSVDPRMDNMLKITGDGRKAALDMRLVEPEAEPGYGTKVNKVVDNVVRIWKETGQQRSTQLIFCDISTPTGDGFNVYDEIRTQLIERGIPQKEIAFIHDADTDAKKKTLFDAVNAGRVRVLLGSTEKMGAGTNVQKKLIAEHDLDAPWRPRDVEQRNGRIQRQGNENAKVQIYRYVTEGSFDAYMWQTLETKQRFISQVMSGDITVREAEDLESGALNFAEIKAIASGNPAVLEKVRIDTEVRKLDMLRAVHFNQQYEIGRQVRTLPAEIKNARAYHTALLEDIATRDAHAGQEFAMTVAGREFKGKKMREAAATALVETIMAGKDNTSLIVRGHYKGFEILSQGSQTKGNDPWLYIRGKNTYEARLNPDNALGTLASIESVLRYLDNDAEKQRSAFERKEKTLADYKAQLNQPFEHEERLRGLLIKQQEINKQLDLDKGDTQVIVETQPGDREADAPVQKSPAKNSVDDTWSDLAGGSNVPVPQQAASKAVAENYMDAVWKEMVSAPVPSVSEDAGRRQPVVRDLHHGHSRG